MVDLIPDDYRRALRLRRWLQRFGLACALVVLLIGATRAGLAHLIGVEQRAMQAIRKVEAATGAQSARLADLQARRDTAERQVRALEDLRGRAVIGELFYAIDAAITGKVWFDELSFAREGEFSDPKVEAAPVAGLPAGVAALAQMKPEPQSLANVLALAQLKTGAPAKAPATASERAWLAQQRAKIRGHALDHSTLAEFINRLGDQPGIGQVRLVDTGARVYSSVQVVDFELAAALGSIQATPR